MNQYSEEEIDDLVANIEWWGPPNQNLRSYRVQDPVQMYRHASFFHWRVEGRIKFYESGEYYSISMHILSDALSGNKGTIESFPSMRFIMNVPFEDVPLYVNTYPELAAWRLRISK